METLKHREADHIVVESGVLCDELEREGLDTGKIIVAHGVLVDPHEEDLDMKKRTT